MYPPGMAIVATQDLEGIRSKLTAWLARQLPAGSSGLEISDLKIPEGAGHSNTTLLFDARWSEGGSAKGGGFVARVRPHGRGVFRLTTSRSVATVSAASFSASSIAAESIVAAFGSGLSTRTEIGGTVPLPTVLAGTRVVVRDALGVERKDVEALIRSYE